MPTSIRFVTAPQTLAAGTAGNMTIVILDQFGDPINAGAGGRVVNLATSSATGTFTNQFGGQITTVTVAAGASTATFNYQDTTAGTATITVSSAGLTTATQTETITAGWPAQLAFVTDPPTH